MAVYNRSGSSLNSVFGVNGSQLPFAYDVNGSKVFPDYVPSGDPDYTKYSYVQKWESKGVASTQGFDIYDGKVFWVRKSGNDTVSARCYVWNLEDGSQALDEAYITIYSGHGNNVCFDYPTVYASSAYAPSDCYVNSITPSFVFSLEKTLLFEDGSMDCDATIDETDKTIMWTIGHDPEDKANNSPSKPYIFSKWDLSNLTDNGDGTYSPANIYTISAQRPKNFYFQGCKFHDGLFWYANGYAGSGSKAYVHGMNPTTGEIVYTIDCETTAEPEGIAWVPDNTVVGRYALYVGFQGMALRKYSFEEKMIL